jgi:DNA-binding transcriptional regulator YhcF (GntR family)
MKIFIDRDNGVPIYLQVKNQIKAEVRIGILKPGIKMPTERELSIELNTSRNTISTAYHELEKDGVLKSYQGKGTFVAEEGELYRDQNVKDKILKFVDLGFETALEDGISSEEFMQMVNRRVKEKLDLMKKISAVYVECNIEQAKMFSEQLSEKTNMDIKPLTITQLNKSNDNTKNILNESQVFITTFNHVNEVTKLTSKYSKDVLGVAINPDLETVVKIARFSIDTKFGIFCISEEFKYKIKGALEKSGLGNINAKYSNSYEEEALKKIIDDCDAIIVSPGRYKDIQELNKGNKEIIKFVFNLDDDSVKALKSKFIELKYN